MQGIRQKYDIEVRGTSNFFANSILVHNSSFIVGRVLVKRRLNWKEKLAKFFGYKVVETEYGSIHASRTVIKSKNFPSGPGYYGEDIWSIVERQIYPLLDNGITLYGEIYGFTPSGRAIQPQYHYGCKPGQLDFFAYRGTITLSDGVVYEMSQVQLEEYCRPKGIKTDIVHYRGKAKDLFPELDTHNHWHQNFLDKLSKRFLERKCPLNNEQVWAEGIVIKIQSPLAWSCLKLKSLNFLSAESVTLDSNELSVEEEDESNNIN